MKELIDNKVILQPNKEPAKLTPKMESFVKEIMVNGLRPVDAYLIVYPKVSRKVASASASRLLKHPAVITALSSLSIQVKSFDKVPKNFIIDKLKTFLATCETEGNKKYFMEALDMMAKLSGHYQHNTTVTKINLTGEAVEFGGFNPDQGELIDVTPSMTEIGTSIDEPEEDDEDNLDDLF